MKEKIGMEITDVPEVGSAKGQEFVKPITGLQKLQNILLLLGGTRGLMPSFGRSS